MPSPLIREQALTVLCDLAFTIGGEVALSPLLVRTLQRFLYHTGFPVGLLLTHEFPEDAERHTEALLELSIGDFILAKRQGHYLKIPQALLPAEPALQEMPETLELLGTHRAMTVALTLPIEGFGHMVLLAPNRPETQLPLTELFTPILSRLANAITLCRSHERDVQRRIEREAHYDPLTELPNASLFSMALKEALLRDQRNGRMVAVAYLDLDDFSRFNERFGPDMADQLLIAFSRRLENHIRPSEFVAHLMADEFALMFPDLPDRQAAEDRLLALLRECGAGHIIAGQSVDLSATVGLSLFPLDAKEADLLMRHAQIALHQAKQEARGSYRLFDAEQDRLAHERRHLLDRLEQALNNHELRLHYQPKIDMRNGRVAGVEALLRWQDPTRGLRPPGEFLPVVENSDLICHIGRWVMGQALAQAAAWRAQGMALPISINIASRHLQQDDFIEQLRDALSATPHAHPQDLEIEILESSAIEDFRRAQAVIQECRNLGIGIALDDFGTGYSSLAYLSQLPATTIKIDQLFIRRMFDQTAEPAIVRAIVQIAEVFGYRLVAEGVETLEHGMVLASMGCRYAQGFGIAKPMPAEDLPEWCRQYTLPAEWRAWQCKPWSTESYEQIKALYLQRRVATGIRPTLTPWCSSETPSPH